jgi:hypothetical protein
MFQAPSAYNLSSFTYYSGYASSSSAATGGGMAYQAAPAVLQQQRSGGTVIKVAPPVSKVPSSLGDRFVELVYASVGKIALFFGRQTV